MSNVEVKEDVDLYYQRPFGIRDEEVKIKRPMRLYKL
jgi:hypothetical protein